MDLQQAIKLDPKSVEARQILKELNSHNINVKTPGKKLEENRKTKLIYRTANSDDEFQEPPKKDEESIYPKIIHPINKPPHKQSKVLFIFIKLFILKSSNNESLKFLNNFGKMYK